MPDAPTLAKPGPIATPAPPVVPKIADDHRFARVPMVRQAMILLIPNPGQNPNKITITEIATGGRVAVEVNGFEREVSLNVRELRELAQHANRIARRAAIRPEWKP